MLQWEKRYLYSIGLTFVTGSRVWITVFWCGYYTPYLPVASSFCGAGEAVS